MVRRLRKEPENDVEAALRATIAELQARLEVLERQQDTPTPGNPSGYIQRFAGVTRNPAGSPERGGIRVSIDYCPDPSGRSYSAYVNLPMDELQYVDRTELGRMVEFSLRGMLKTLTERFSFWDVRTAMMQWAPVLGGANLPESPYAPRPDDIPFDPGRTMTTDDGESAMRFLLSMPDILNRLR